MSLISNAITFLVLYGCIINFVSSEDVFQDVRLRFYYGADNTTYIEYDLNKTTNLLKHSKFYQNQSTILYLHGWNEKVNEAVTLSHIVNAYLTRKEENVLLLNYEKLASNFYPTVVEHTIELGKKIALALTDLFKAGLNPSRLHLMGFSLGAHICGEIGRALRPNYILSRITGFDPASVMYYCNGKYVELNKNDCKFVDIIHSDKGMTGGATSSGHADFYPNGGSRPQPGCGNTAWQYFSTIVGDHCAHDASVHFFAESVSAKTKMFLATNRNDANVKAYMGYYCSKEASGDFDLETGAFSSSL